MSAVILLQEMQLRKRLDPQTALEEEEELSTGNENSKDRTAVLAIAYHNMGVEQEFLRSYPAAILSYKKAVNFAEKHLGPEDGITVNLRNVYENAKNELDVAVFKKKTSAKQGSQLSGGGVKAAKYYGAQGGSTATGGAGKGKKQQVQSLKQSDAYDQMITPRNVRVIKGLMVYRWRE
jgi:hypothetical protein